MDVCIRCNQNEEQVRLFDGIYITEAVKICEMCAIIANIPIIKRPTPEQLKASEKNFGVKERLSAMAGIFPEKKQKTKQEELEELEKNKGLVKPEELVFKLVDNFHWIIQTNRRRKGLTLRQLAETLSESESALKMLERAVVPGKSLDLLGKLEQFFGVELIKKDKTAEILKQPQVIENLPENKVAKEPEPKKEPIKEGFFQRKFLKKPEEDPLGILEEAQEQEGEEMIKIAIDEEKNPKVLEKEKPYGVAMRPIDFRKDKIRDFNIADLKRIDDNIDKDFTYNKKTKEETGKEQLDDFGKESFEEIRRRIYRTSPNEKKEPGKTPTIHELAKLKQEKERGLLGKDIEIIEEKKPEIPKKTQEFEM